VLIASFSYMIILHSLKRIMDVPRPLGVLSPDSFHIIGWRLTKHAFPSGHTTTYFYVNGSYCLFISGKVYLYLEFHFCTFSRDIPHCSGSTLAYRRAGRCNSWMALRMDWCISCGQITVGDFSRVAQIIYGIIFANLCNRSAFLL